MCRRRGGRGRSTWSIQRAAHSRYFTTTRSSYFRSLVPPFDLYQRPRKYAIKEKIAPPKNIPKPTKRKISFPRTFAKAPLLSIPKRAHSPPAVHTKKMRRNLRELPIF